MWCAYVFAGLALVSLPAAIALGTAAIITWIAQTFLQLVLLSVIIVGQNIAGEKTESVILDTHDKVISLLSEIHGVHFPREVEDAEGSGTETLQGSQEEETREG